MASPRIAAGKTYKEDRKMQAAHNVTVSDPFPSLYPSEWLLDGEQAPDEKDSADRGDEDTGKPDSENDRQA